jgi:hypothetical protein
MIEKVDEIGLVAQTCKLPFVKEMCCLDMCARTFKYILRTRLRTALLNFRAVGAQHIEEEMKGYVVNLFNLCLGVGPKSQKVYASKFDPIVLQ